MSSRDPQNFYHLFSPKTLSSTLQHSKVLPTDHQQANKSTTLIGITQDSPKRLKKIFYKAQATTQWKRRWSTDSPFFSHIQRILTTMTYRFLRLSMVRIFPRVADQAKKAAIKGTIVHQVLF
jgi:hypothetical protein